MRYHVKAYDSGGEGGLVAASNAHPNWFLMGCTDDAAAAMELMLRLREYEWCEKVRIEKRGALPVRCWQR
jgi:hypothetical protein